MDCVETPQVVLQDGVPTGPHIFSPAQSASSVFPASHLVPFEWDQVIRQYQPMGIRVITHLPYLSNESTPLFVIKIQPYIPWLGERTYNGAFWWKNQMPVRAPPYRMSYNNQITTDPVTNITQHSPPPILSALATGHRRWGGDLKYRLRTIANFSNAGYLVTGLVKGLSRTVGNRDPYKEDYPLPPLWDENYLEYMSESYVSSDTTFTRHIEVTAPFTYPVPYYDQYQSMSTTTETWRTTTGAANTVLRDMGHGENYIFVGVRSAITGTAVSTLSGSIMFELEYAAGDNFWMDIPFVPFGGSTQSKRYYGVTPNTTSLVTPFSQFWTTTFPNPGYSVTGSSAWNITTSSTATTATISTATRTKRSAPMASYRVFADPDLGSVQSDESETDFELVNGGSPRPSEIKTRGYYKK